MNTIAWVGLAWIYLLTLIIFRSPVGLMYTSGMFFEILPFSLTFVVPACVCNVSLHFSILYKFDFEVVTCTVEPVSKIHGGGFDFESVVFATFAILIALIFFSTDGLLSVVALVGAFGRLMPSLSECLNLHFVFVHCAPCRHTGGLMYFQYMSGFVCRNSFFLAVLVQSDK